MTPKQEERIREKILKIKKALAADKKQWGGFYHDGRGLRYLPPELYIKINDYKGALRYFNWFNKNFSDDIAYPLFLFEWTLSLLKTGKIKEAEKKALQAFMSNTYMFDHFLGKELLQIIKHESSDWEIQSLEQFPYTWEQKEMKDFAKWLGEFTTSDKFYKFANELFEIDKKLEGESDTGKRSALLNKRSRLLNKV